MPRRKDIWRCGLIPRPIEAVLREDMADAQIHWFQEEPPFSFLADPFGWHEGSAFHVFAEHYDYRTRRGAIERLTFDTSFCLVERRPALTEPWHLSYPFVFEGEGEVWMLPEAHRSGRLTLYRAHGRSDDWRPECTVELDCVPVDASILRYQDRWWLFYSPATTKETRLGHLHVAWADRLCGPWTAHSSNPVRVDRGSARPGGTPALIGNRIMLPVQDCRLTYGGAVRPLWIERLDETTFVAEAGAALAIPASDVPAYREGMHTLSACGAITLFDAKRIDRSLKGLALDLRRLLGGYAAR